MNIAICILENYGSADDLQRVRVKTGQEQEFDEPMVLISTNKQYSEFLIPLAFKNNIIEYSKSLDKDSKPVTNSKVYRKLITGLIPREALLKGTCDSLKKDFPIIKACKGNIKH